MDTTKSIHFYAFDSSKPLVFFLLMHNRTKQATQASSANFPAKFAPEYLWTAYMNRWENWLQIPFPNTC